MNPLAVIGATLLAVAFGAFLGVLATLALLQTQAGLDAMRRRLAQQPRGNEGGAPEGGHWPSSVRPPPPVRMEFFERTGDTRPPSRTA